MDQIRIRYGLLADVYISTHKMINDKPRVNNNNWTKRGSQDKINKKVGSFNIRNFECMCVCSITKHLCNIVISILKLIQCSLNIQFDVWNMVNVFWSNEIDHTPKPLGCYVNSCSVGWNNIYSWLIRISKRSNAVLL